MSYYGTAAQAGTDRHGNPIRLAPPRVPAADVVWCDEAGCPASECVHCADADRS